MTESVTMWSTQPSGFRWRQVGGWGLLVLGVAGLLLPVLPGAPLLVAGLVILSADYHWARLALRKGKLWMRTMNRQRSRWVRAIRSWGD